ncbi:MAG: hypothetical protein HY674_16515 [Chloroflexi bacterium]|nr:hypothetical protein [Chloroflexota bacterium]
MNKSRALLLVGLLIAGMAVLLPNFMKTRVTTSGGDYTFRFRVVDEASGLPVPGVTVEVNSPYVPAGFSSDDKLPVTGTNGLCEVKGGFPTVKRTFTCPEGRLKVQGSLIATAPGYQRYSNSLAAIAGEIVPYEGAGHYTVKLSKPLQP